MRRRWRLVVFRLLFHSVKPYIKQQDMLKHISPILAYILFVFNFISLQSSRKNFPRRSSNMQRQIIPAIFPVSLRTSLRDRIGSRVDRSELRNGFLKRFSNNSGLPVTMVLNFITLNLPETRYLQTSSVPLV